MSNGLFRPDGVAIGLFVAGVVLVFVPLMIMPGAIAIASAFGYWLIMLLVKFVYRRRASDQL